MPFVGRDVGNKVALGIDASDESESAPFSEIKGYFTLAKSVRAFYKKGFPKILSFSTKVYEIFME